MKGLIPAAQKMMPLMMLAFLTLAVIQLVIQMHLSPGHLLYVMLSWLTQAGALYVGLAATLWALVLAGITYEWRAEAAARRDRAGIRRRRKPRGWMMDVLARLTNRAALEDLLAKQDKVTIIDAGALAATLKSQVIGQDAVCDDIAQQLRRRLALTVRGKPVGIFLLATGRGAGPQIAAFRHDANELAPCGDAIIRLA
jgi:hypothetical protein